MKATNKEQSVSIEKSVEGVAIPESLVSIEIIESKVKHLKKNLNILQKYAEDINIETADDLVIAENNIKSCTENVSSAEEVRKALGDPYRITVGEINSHIKKNVTTPFEEIKTSVKKEVVNYKTVQAALAAKEAEKKRLEAEKIANEKSAESKMIIRIQSQLMARIYGGFWFDKNNVKQTHAGSININDCNSLLDIISNKIPGKEKFPHLSEEYISMVKDVKVRLAKYTAYLIELDSSNEEIRAVAKKNIENAKYDAMGTVNDDKDSMASNIAKEAKAEIKATETKAKNESKGLRNNIKFEVANISDVPKEWIIINDAEVKSWAMKNREKLLEDIKHGKSVFNGIKFSIEQTYVSR